jgi:hypothetical protein
MCHSHCEVDLTFKSLLGDRDDDWLADGLAMFTGVDGPPGDWALDLPSQRQIHGI